VKRGADRVGRAMRYDVDPRPGEGEVRGVSVPVFFLLGRHDLNTPSALAAAYLPRLGAPLARVEWLERSAHFPFFEEPEGFRAALLRARAEAERYWRGGARR
jgi:pimeloyl-ACP methyl ester carboxylesterase